MPTDKSQEGVYGIEYYHGRQTKQALKYRLARRAEEAVRAVKRSAHRGPWRILDLGTADGLMLQHMLNSLETSLVVGVDLSFELLAIIDNPTIRPTLANGIRLPFTTETFNLIVATAVIEHVSDPRQMLAECRRVLTPGGLAVITTPDPFWERVATGIGHLPDEGHQETLNLDRLRTYAAESGFQVVEAYKFMMSPWGFPRELVIEMGMRALGLSFMLVNQIVVAQKPRAETE